MMNLVVISGSVQLSLIAFSVVFIVIVFLMFMMLFLHKICYKLEQRKTLKNEKIASVSSKSENEEELIAVLTAAVLQYSSVSARIISFHPSAVQAPTKSSWRNFGRVQNFEQPCKR